MEEHEVVDKTLEDEILINKIKKLQTIIKNKLKRIHGQGNILSIHVPLIFLHDLPTEGEPIVFDIKFRYPCKERKITHIVDSAIDRCSFKESTFKFSIDRFILEESDKAIESFSNNIVLEIIEYINKEINKFHGKK